MAVEPVAIKRQNSHDSGDLPLWARVADWMVVALIVLGVFVAIEGGFVELIAGVRVSVRSGWRPLGWAVAVLLVRHRLIRRPPIHRHLGATLMTAGRAAGPLRDDLVLLGRTADRPRRTPRWMYAVAVIAFYAALTALMTYPQVREIDRSVSEDIGDPLLSTWRLAWTAHQLPRDPLHLFDANIFHPERGTLAFSDAMLVPSLTIAPLVWMGVHPLLAYNLLLLSGFALSGAAMFVLVRYFTHHTGAALLAGFVFAFLPYRFMHYAHLELQMAQWMPLALWAFHRTVQNGRWRDGLLTGLFIALQTLSSWYYGIFFVTFLAVVGTVTLLGAERSRLVRAVPPLAAGAALAAILTLPFTIPYFHARRAVGERPVSEIEFYSATPQNYLAAHPWNGMFGSFTSSLGGQERELFQGFMVPLIALIGLWPPLSTVRIAYALGLIVAFEASLGYNGAIYPVLHDWVLPYRGLRVPARMAILVGLGLAILVGFGAARMATAVGRRLPAARVLVILGVLFFLEYRSTIAVRRVWTRPPPVYEALRRDTPSVLFELPLVVPDTAFEPIYMYFSTFHWQKLINGYSGFAPPSYSKLVDMIAAGPPDDVTMKELRRRGTDYVVVHGAFFQDREAWKKMVAALDQRADLDLVHVSRWLGHQTLVYRVSR